MIRAPDFMVRRGNELHFDTRRFLEHYGYPVTPQNEKLVAELFEKAARETWPDVAIAETTHPMPERTTP